MSDSASPWTVAHQASLSMGFPRQEYWSGLPFPSPRNLPDSRIKPMSPALAGGFFTTEPSREPQFSSVQFSCSVVSDSLRPHESQHTRHPCPSQLLEFTQTRLHRVSDAIQPSHPLSSPSPPAFNLSHHQGIPPLSQSPVLQGNDTHSRGGLSFLSSSLPHD